MSNKVIALIVSYNGEQQLSTTVQALLDQVEKVVILDNNSDEKSKTIIYGLRALPKVEVVQFESNMGIGYALNKGIEIAKKENFDWVLTMDQDSTAMADMVAQMLLTSRAKNNAEVICPLLMLDDSIVPVEKDRPVKYSITSGNLIHINVFKRVGEFNENYFIDSVDFEFCLRLANINILMVQSGKAKLKHQLGERISKNFRIFECSYTKHSPLRKYYIVRNHFYLIAKFWKTNPLFLAKKSAFLIRDFFLVLILDENRLDNLKMYFFGIKDFLNSKQGKFNS